MGPVLLLAAAVLAVYAYTSLPAAVGQIPLTQYSGSLSFSELGNLSSGTFGDFVNGNSDPGAFSTVVTFFSYSWLIWVFAGLVALSGAAGLGRKITLARNAAIVGGAGGTAYSVVAALIVLSLAGGDIPGVSPGAAAFILPLSFGASLGCLALIPRTQEQVETKLKKQGMTTCPHCAKTTPEGGSSCQWCHKLLHSGAAT